MYRSSCLRCANCAFRGRPNQTLEQWTLGQLYADRGYQTDKWWREIIPMNLPKNVTGEYFTRGNSNKLLVKRCRYELRKNFFSNRIVNMWNSLPDYVIMTDTINTFKNRLDAHWKQIFSISLLCNLHRNRRLMHWILLQCFHWWASTSKLEYSEYYRCLVVWSGFSMEIWCLLCWKLTHWKSYEIPTTTTD